MAKEMTREEHIKRHQELHKALDELSADFIAKTGKLPSKTTIFELMKWSFEQCKNPTIEDAPVGGNMCPHCNFTGSTPDSLVVHIGNFHTPEVKIRS